jgi:hypothetical protein
VYRDGREPCFSTLDVEKEKVTVLWIYSDIVASLTETWRSWRTYQRCFMSRSRSSEVSRLIATSMHPLLFGRIFGERAPAGLQFSAGSDPAKVDPLRNTRLLFRSVSHAVPHERHRGLFKALWRTPYTVLNMCANRVSVRKGWRTRVLMFSLYWPFI